MKKIAITSRLIENEDYYEIRESLDIQWGKLCKSLNVLPIILPYEVDFENYFKFMPIDGIILTGGNDLSILSSNELSIKRDQYEKRLLKYAIDKNIPLLGVCRGMQVIANYFEFPLVEVKNQTAIRHKIIVNNESAYSDILSQIEEVNSFHKFAVKSVSNDFIVSALNETGMIKAIEHKKLNILAHMWHPEREVPFHQNELKLIKEFFND